MIYEITPTSLDETQFLSSFFPAVRKWMYQGGTFNKKDLSNEDLVLLLWKNFRVPQYLPEEVYECISKFSQEVLQ